MKNLKQITILFAFIMIVFSCDSENELTELENQFNETTFNKSSSQSKKVDILVVFNPELSFGSKLQIRSEFMNHVGITLFQWNYCLDYEDREIWSINNMTETAFNSIAASLGYDYFYLTQFPASNDDGDPSGGDDFIPLAFHFDTSNCEGHAF